MPARCCGSYWAEFRYTGIRSPFLVQERIRNPARWLQSVTGAAATVVVLGGCCCGGAAGGYATPSPAPGSAALAAWSDFPAAQVPRPILLPINLVPFPDLAEEPARLARICNKFDFPSTAATSAVPSKATVTWPDGTKAIYPARSADDVFAEMTSFKPEGAYDCVYVTPAPVTAARYGTATFVTDRGRAQMSAWLFTVTGVPLPWAYPAVALSAFWHPGKIAFGGRPATVSADGLAVTFTATGRCASTFKGLVAESTTAVEVSALAPPAQPAASPCMTLSISDQLVTVALRSPLGGRVLVDAQGTPLPVCPAKPKAGSAPCWSLPA